MLSGKREKLHRLWPPSPGPAIAPDEGQQRGDERGHQRDDIGQDQSVARGIECKGECADADRPWLDDRAGANGGPDVMAIGERRKRDVGTNKSGRESCRARVWQYV